MENAFQAKLLLLLNAENEPVWISVDDLCMIAASSEGPLFTAKDGAVYRYPLTMKQLVRQFGDLGFERLDRNVLANLKQAEEYDPELRKLYFKREPDRTEDDLYATVSAINAAKVRGWIVRESHGRNLSYSVA